MLEARRRGAMERARLRDPVQPDPGARQRGGAIAFAREVAHPVIGHALEGSLPGRSTTRTVASSTWVARSLPRRNINIGTPSKGEIAANSANCIRAIGTLNFANGTT